MTIGAFEGPAGTGKTHCLMERLASDIERRPLREHERVLALTFMHGSRRRLDSRLRDIQALNKKFHATTLDSFAWRLCQRWHRLAVSMGHNIPAEQEYEATCALAANLLARPVVRSWLAASYPFIIVDEAQDLNHARSTMISETITSCHVLLAFDEFQCLDPALRPLPIEAWLRQACDAVILDRCRRTEDAELLQAAGAVRNGQPVRRDGRRFKVMETPGKPNYAATCATNFITWRGRGTVALLTPSRRGGFAENIVSLVSAGPLGKQRNGPYPIEWENSDDAERITLRDGLAMPENCGITEALTHLEPHVHIPAVKSARDWISRQRSTLGSEHVTAEDVLRQIDRYLATRRRYGTRATPEFSAMTIQQAKNREFDHVIIIWPYTVVNDDEQKRRLLYNAITRARRSCVVLVQAQGAANAPPFV